MPVREGHACRMVVSVGAGPFGHVGANLADHLQGGETVNAVDAGQVHSRHPVQVGPDVEAGRIALTLPTTIVAWRPAVAVVLEPLQLGFDLPIALGNLIVVEPVQFQGLGQLYDVLLSPVPLKRSRDGRLVRFHTRATQPRATKPGQLSGVTLAAHDGFDDVHAGLPSCRSSLMPVFPHAGLPSCRSSR